MWCGLEVGYRKPQSCQHKALPSSLIGGLTMEKDLGGPKTWLTLVVSLSCQKEGGAQSDHTTYPKPWRMVFVVQDGVV